MDQVSEVLAYREPGYDLDIYIDVDRRSMRVVTSGSGFARSYVFKSSDAVEGTENLKSIVGDRFPMGVSDLTHCVVGNALFRVGAKPTLEQALASLERE